MNKRGNNQNKSEISLNLKQTKTLEKALAKKWNRMGKKIPPHSNDVFKRKKESQPIKACVIHLPRWVNAAKKVKHIGCSNVQQKLCNTV